MPASSSAGGLMTTQNAFGSGRSGDFFPSPWLDMATLAMPDNNKNGLEWCEYIWQSQGTYRMACERKISYFLTEVEFGSADPREPLGDDEKEQYQALFSDTLEAIGAIQAADRDCECYGNSFTTFVVPFKRFLISPFGNHLQWSLREMGENPYHFNFHYDAGKNEFNATDPVTKKRGAWKVNDQPEDLERKLRLKVWSPHEMEMHTDYWTGNSEYYWKIPTEYKRSIRTGNLFDLERCPVEVLSTIQQNAFYRFDRDAIFHMKEPTLGGVRSRGWGISRILTNFRDIWYVQVMRRYNEAIALDYIVPFRLITPEVRQGAQSNVADSLRSTNAGDMRGQFQSMLRRHRRDPGTWNFLGFPVKYQLLGGEAKQLAPSELIEQGYDVLLNATGTPTQMYRGDLTVQTAPVSCRLFEATHHHIVHNNNRLLSWMVQQLSQLLSLPVVKATMRSTTYTDDFNKQMAQLQLMMGQAISQTTGLRAMGMDYKDEQRLIAEESSFQQKLQAEVQEEMQQSAFGQQIAKGQGGPGMPPDGGGAGGAPPQGGGGAEGAPAGQQPGPVSQMPSSPNVPMTPQDMLSQAESIAQDLLGLPESQKDSELRALKQKNEVLHSLVTAKLKQIRQKAQTAGGAQLLGQQPAAQPGG